ncbi:MAG: hypothetical protein GX379_03675 [Clostridiales bacterium]|jgi:uncharacterized BrkB/YihY/UPF0761 family membrane protein|nr:hypothetical protein [Clostridiales bacterium]
MKKLKAKRVGAIIGIVAILSLYIISFIIGIFFSDEYPQLFMASVFLAVIIPIIIYCFIAVYRYVHKKPIPEDYDEEGKTNNQD